MKKLFFAAVAALALVSCQDKTPTISPEKATMHVGDTLQFVVTGVSNPEWTLFFNDEAEKDILKIIDNDRIVALKTGKTKVGFPYVYKHKHVLEFIESEITVVE